MQNKRGIKSLCKILWNALLLNIRRATSLFSFRSLLKSYFYNKAFNIDNVVMLFVFLHLL